MLDEKLLTGIIKLDEQHETVISLTHEIKKSIKNKISKEKIIELIKALDFYANEHFSYEEILAQLCNFYRLEELKDAHNDFRNHYKLIKKFYEPHKTLTPIIYGLLIATVLENWLEFHFKHIEYDFINVLKKSIQQGLDISNI